MDAEYLHVDKIKGKIINKGIYEREIKILSSPSSTIKRSDFTVGMSIIGSGKVHERHKHSKNEELIIVIKGKGLAKIANKKFEICMGSVIGLGKNEPHEFINTGTTDLQLLWIYSPPGAEKKYLKE